MEISAVIRKVAYRKEESYWSILECTSAKGVIKVTGVTNAKEGQAIYAQGEWGVDNKGKKQFKANSITQETPDTEEGIERFLACGVLPGIGPKLANKIITKFGVEALSVIDGSPQKLLSIEGVSQKLLNRITEAWEANKNLEHISDVLSEHKVPIALANQIQSEFGQDALKMLKTNPYEMTFKITGIGFKFADKIALAVGIEKDSPHRIRSGVLYELDKAVSNGSCGIELENMVKNVSKMLEVNKEGIHVAVKQLLLEERPLIELQDMIVWRKDLYDAEEAIADLLLSKLHDTRPLLPPDKIEEMIKEQESNLGFKLDEKQQEALRLGLTYGVMILMGGPGCGKTFTTDSILTVLKKMNKEVVLTAPTGKAAQRASEATGLPAETMHRLMGVEDEESTPQSITADILTADEFSMADVPIVHHLCNAVSIHTRMNIVGDFNQLLSVGAGNVLKDMVESGVIPKVELTKVFRQAEGSLIIQNAHNINKGLPLKNGRSADDDFWIMTENNTKKLANAKKMDDDSFAESVADIVCYLVSERIPEKRGIAPEDIWVLSPTNKGPCGVEALNKRLQETLNPNPSDSVMNGSTRFGVGDRVMQVRNNYDLDIFNGDVGYVEYVNKEDGLLEVQFEGKESLVPIPFEELDGLKLGYASTIHRSQGSQSRAVVIPLLMRHYMLLQRNVTYTGITRAKELAVMIGESEAIKLSVTRTDNTKRVTRLKQLLLDGM